MGLQPGLDIVVAEADLILGGLALDQADGERLLLSRTVAECKAILLTEVCAEERVFDWGTRQFGTFS